MAKGSNLIVSLTFVFLFLLPISIAPHQFDYNTEANGIIENKNNRVIPSDNWLEGWELREAHTIAGSIGAGTSYQIKFTVHYGSGVDSGEDVFCNTKCQSDFDDIRFTDDDGITLLDYWRQDYYDSDTATFWVEIKDNLDSDVEIFMYYGNETVDTISNGTATFLLFDDFLGSAGTNVSASIWNVAGDGADGIKLDGNGNMNLVDCVDPSDRNGIYSYQTFGLYDISVMSKAIASTGLIESSSFGDLSNHDGDGISWYANTWENGIRFRTFNDGVASVTTDMVIGDLTQWHIYNTHWFSDYACLYFDGILKANHTNDIPDEYLSCHANEGTGGTGGYSLVDWIIVRKSLPSEPVQGDWGEEIELPDSIIWHHECSDISGMFQYMDWNMDWWYEDYLVTDGNMTSDGSKWGFSDIPPASSPVRWHGPIYAHNFTQPFTLGDFKNLTVHMEVDNSQNGYSGILDVYLCDSDFMPVLSTVVTDSWNWKQEGIQRATYRFGNGSYVYQGSEVAESYSSFDGSMSLWFDETEGIMADVPGFGPKTLAYPNASEMEREIKYIVIKASRLDSYTWMPSFVNDIYLEYVGFPVEDSIAPLVTGPSDITYEAGSIGHSITWSAIENNPLFYTIQLDGYLIVNDSWDGSDVEISIDGHDPDNYEYTVTFVDEYANEGSHTVGVTVVDTTAPDISKPAELHYKIGETNHSISWTADDLYPESYMVYRNDTLIQSGAWNTTNESIIVDVDGLAVGSYLYLITCVDESGNSVIDVVLVTVLPEDFDGYFTSFSFVITVGATIVIVIGIIVICRNRGQSGGSTGGYHYG